MMDRDDPRGAGQGPLDRPEREAGDPMGENAYPGGGMMPPTADLDDPIPESGMPGEPEAEPSQLDDEEGLEPSERPD